MPMLFSLNYRGFIPTTQWFAREIINIVEFNYVLWGCESPSSFEALIPKLLDRNRAMLNVWSHWNEKWTRHVRHYVRFVSTSGRDVLFVFFQGPKLLWRVHR